MRRYAQTEMAPLVRKHGAAGRAGRGALPQRPAEARVRVDGHPQRGRGVRGAVRQLPVARHHDGGASPGSSGCRCATRAPTSRRRGAASGNLLCSSGHVNVTLGQQDRRRTRSSFDASSLTIDFLPPEDLRDAEDDRDPRVARRRDVHEQPRPSRRWCRAGSTTPTPGRARRSAPIRGSSPRRTRSASSTCATARSRRRAPCSSTCSRAIPRHTRALANLAEVGEPRRPRRRGRAAARAPGAARARAAASLLQSRHGGDAARGLPRGA